MGSLYTSIVPCLILGGVGECVAERDCPKVVAAASISSTVAADLTCRQIAEQRLALTQQCPLSAAGHVH